MLIIAYAGTAFILTFSEGAQGQFTIYNIIGIAMFTIPVIIYKKFNLINK